MEYNHHWPNSSPGYMSPGAFATDWLGPDSATLRQSQTSDSSQRVQGVNQDRVGRSVDALPLSEADT